MVLCRNLHHCLLQKSSKLPWKPSFLVIRPKLIDILAELNAVGPHAYSCCSLLLKGISENVPVFHALQPCGLCSLGNHPLYKMYQLPEDIKKKCEVVNFVVKRTTLRFNQMDPYLSRVVYCIGKKGGGSSLSGDGLCLPI